MISSQDNSLAGSRKLLQFERFAAALGLPNPNMFRNALLHLAQVMTMAGDWL
jgi:hypothetical protein